MVRIENGVVYYTPYGEEERDIGLLADAEASEGYMSIGGHGFPLDHFKELQTAWDELYPNGKPVEVVESLPQPSTEDLDKSEMTLKIIETLTELGVI